MGRDETDGRLGRLRASVHEIEAIISGRKDDALEAGDADDAPAREGFSCAARS